jgi:hypothetical protein
MSRILSSRARRHFITRNASRLYFAVERADFHLALSSFKLGDDVRSLVRLEQAPSRPTVLE